MVDASERLQVLLSQEENIYKTSDYLARMQIESPTVEPETDTPVSNGDGSFSPNSKKRKAMSRVEEPTQHSLQGGKEDSSFVSEGSSASQINKHWREKICEWAYQVVDHFDLHREVVSIAMNHLDRFLAVYPATVDKNLFQLLAMTCLYLSIKLNEYKHLLIPGSKSSMDTILQLSRGFFTLEQMEKMEHDVLQRLQWHVHPPTPQVFVKHLLFFFSVEEHEVHDLAQFMVELSVMDYFFVAYKPSEVAAAAILNARERLLPSSAPQLNFPFLSPLLDIHSTNVRACQDRLSLIYNQAHDQAPDSSSEQTPTKVTEQTHRTTSPVSVMAAPQPSVVHYSSAQLMNESMDVEYSDGEDL